MVQMDVARMKSLRLILAAVIGLPAGLLAGSTKAERAAISGAPSKGRGTIWIHLWMPLVVALTSRPRPATLGGGPLGPGA